MKKLIEQRAALLAQLTAITESAKTEERAMTDDEVKKFDDLEKCIKAIDTTIAAEERATNAANSTPVIPTECNATNSDDVEERAFADYVMGRVTELRSGEQNMTMSNNGAIIPTTIANRIIKTVKEICPILSGATMYSVKGTLKVPVWGKANTAHDIAVGYQTEFTDITADSGKFTSIDLGGYLAGALVLIGKSVENNGSFNVVDFIVAQMAEEIAAFIEKELLTGSGSSAAQGAVNTSNTLTAADDTTICLDDLIGLQSQVKSVYQANACWTMAQSTFLAIQKLKDTDGRPLLQSDIANGFPYTLLGKPVHISDNMASIAASAKTVLYGDYSGLSVNFRETISIEVLREKYATQHAIGVNAWFEFDAKVTDSQKLAVLVQAAS